MIVNHIKLFFSELFDDPSKSSAIAYSVDDTDGVYFVPALSGLGVSQTLEVHLIIFEHDSRC